MPISKGHAAQSRVMAAKRKTKAERSAMIRKYLDERGARSGTDEAIAARRAARPAAPGSADATAAMAAEIAASSGGGGGGGQAPIQSAAPAPAKEGFDFKGAATAPLGIAAMMAAPVAGLMASPKLRQGLMDRVRSLGDNLGGRFGTRAALKAAGKPKSPIDGIGSTGIRSARGNVAEAATSSASGADDFRGYGAPESNTGISSYSPEKGSIPNSSGGATTAIRGTNTGDDVMGSVRQFDAPTSLPGIDDGATSGIVSPNTTQGLMRDAGVDTVVPGKAKPFSGIQDFANREAAKPGIDIDPLAEKRSFGPIADNNGAFGNLGARINTKSNEIMIDTKTLLKKFKEKAWTNPRMKGVDPLPSGIFDTPEKWYEFVVNHERMHFLNPRYAKEGKAAYENRMNQLSLKKMWKAMQEGGMEVIKKL